MATSIIGFSGPFSAEDLHLKVKDKGIDLVTVYRSLSTFTELGLLTTVNFQDGTLRYEYSCTSEQGHHHHIICQKCKKVDPVDFCLVQDQEELIAQMGYSNITHKLEFFGLCDQCSA
ncbi:transcriptional repressor [bacterium]|nr:transcriptional repressor [bacterium]